MPSRFCLRRMFRSIRGEAMAGPRCTGPLGQVTLDVAEVLCSKGADGEALLHAAAEAGEVGVVEVLLAAGVPVDSQRGDGWDPVARGRW